MELLETGISLGVRRKSGQATQKVDKMKMAQDFLKSLQELKPDWLWRSSERAAEVDRRLSRESSLTESLASETESV